MARDLLLGAACALVVAAAMLAVATGWTASGPGCPGNPAWLGYCASAPMGGL